MMVIMNLLIVDELIDILKYVLFVLNMVNFGKHHIIILIENMDALYVVGKIGIIVIKMLKNLKN